MDTDRTLVVVGYSVKPTALLQDPRLQFTTTSTTSPTRASTRYALTAYPGGYVELNDRAAGLIRMGVAKQSDVLDLVLDCSIKPDFAYWLSGAGKIEDIEINRS